MGRPQAIGGGVIELREHFGSGYRIYVTECGGEVVVVLAGGDKTIRQWAQGNVYTGTGTTGKYVRGAINAPAKPSSLVDSTGKIFSRSRPQYTNYAPSRKPLRYPSIIY